MYTCQSQGPIWIPTTTKVFFLSTFSTRSPVMRRWRGAIKQSASKMKQKKEWIQTASFFYPSHLNHCKALLEIKFRLQMISQKRGMYVRTYVHSIAPSLSRKDISRDFKTTSSDREVNNWLLRVTSRESMTDWRVRPTNKREESNLNIWYFIRIRTILRVV